MEVKEFLFVDTRRIDSYAEQIGPPVIYDKVPVWSAELSITGPKGATTQDRHARSATRSEKIDALVSHLRENELLTEGRPIAERDVTFAIETCSATRILVPANTDKNDQSHELAMWMSIPDARVEDNPNQSGILCLLEDYQGPDTDRPAHRPQISVYTLLMSLIQGLHDDNRNTILVEPFHITDPETEPMDILDAWHKAHDYMESFVKNPVEILTKLGCVPGPRRQIEALYRVRELGSDDFDGIASHRGRISVFGYPIYIAAAN